MELMKETDKRFIGIEKKIGLFVIIAIVGIAAVIIFTGIQHDIFTKKTKIYFLADSGQGINEGMAVKLSGFKIGKVVRLSLNEVAMVKVELSINNKYIKWIKTDSKARLFKEGFIGDSVIEITPGSAEAKQITENGIIEFERAKGLAEIAEELKDEIKPVLNNIKEIVHYINSPQGDVKQTLKNLRKFSEDLPETHKHLNALLKNTDKGLNATINKIDSVLDSTKQTINNVEGLIKKIDRDIPNILEKTNKSLENIQKTTEDIKKVTEQTAPKIPLMLQKGEDVADGAKEITDAAKKIWPIRLFIKEPEEKILNTDSYE